MSTEPKKTRARKAPAAKSPAAATPAPSAPARPTPAASAPAPDAKPAAPSAGPQGLLMIGVVIVLIALAGIVFLIATGRGIPAPTNNMAEAAAAPAPAMPNRGRALPSGLRFEAISEGSGPLIRATDTVLLRYELRLVGRDQVIDGDINAPAPVPLSPTGTVRGFAEALTLMRAGGEARFWVPPSLGYGRGQGPIGPNDILEFHVKVERIMPASEAASSAAPAAGGDQPSEEDVQNLIEAMQRARASGQR